MAQKKTAAKSNTTKKKTSSAPKKKSTNTTAKKSEEVLAAERQKWAIGLFAGAILMLCITLIEGERVWKFFHMGMFAFFGTAAYVLPLMLFYVAIMMAMDRPLGSVTSNLIGVGVFVFLISSAIHIFANTDDYLSTQGLWDQMLAAWNTYDEIPNSGLFGAFLGGVLSKLAGKIGAAIINVLLLVVLTMFLTGLTLARLGRLISQPVKNMSKSTNDIFTHSIERSQEREEEKQAIRETEKIESEPKGKTLGTRFPWELPSRKKSDYELDAVQDTAQVKKPQGNIQYTGTPTFDPASSSTAQTQDGIIVDENGEIISTIVNNVPQSNAEENLDIVPDDIIKPSELLHIAQNIKDEIPAETAIINSQQDDDEIFFEDSEGAQHVEYHLPPIECLNAPVRSSNEDCTEELSSNGRILLSTLDSFNVNAKITNICRGPSVTRYELLPDAGVRISKITNLADDIALHLAAPGIRIEAPIPGKAAIGIEVPNKIRSMVYMRELISSDIFKNAKSKINVALGKDIAGNIICADLAKMPHLLIAGTTGSGKSVCINTMITSILYNATPDEVKILLIDPKQVEFIVYNGIAHLAVPVVTDARKASGALSWAVSEMEKRYKLFSEKGVRDIGGYNKYVDKHNRNNSSDEPMLKKMHQIVIFIDELSDLMMVAPNEVESSICRLAQMARAAGMHLVIATQRPSVNVITGVIKANIPSRIALSVSSGVDSRTILDMSGAEKLLGNGDMLFNPTGSSKPLRVQGCFISDEEVESLVDFIKNEAESTYDEEIMTEIEKQAAKAGKDDKEGMTGDGSMEYQDEMFPNAVEVVLEAKMASTTLLQRKLRLGYARAARIMDELEEHGIIGPFEGSKPREVLITKQQWMEKCALTGSNPQQN